MVTQLIIIKSALLNTSVAIHLQTIKILWYIGKTDHYIIHPPGNRASWWHLHWNNDSSLWITLGRRRIWILTGTQNKSSYSKDLSPIPFIQLNWRPNIAIRGDIYFRIETYLKENVKYSNTHTHTHTQPSQ